MPDIVSIKINEIDKEMLKYHLDAAIEILNKYPRKTYIRQNGETEDMSAIKAYIENARMYCKYLTTL